jgi:hydrogenase expression/formation protein HypE
VLKLEQKPFYEVGKLSPLKLEEIILKHIKNRNSSVSPSIGVDFGIHGNDLILTTDPLSYHRPLGTEFASKFGFNVILTDFLTSGNLPEFLTATLLFPTDVPDLEIELYWKTFTDQCYRWNIDIVTGHTGRYPSASLPLIGSVTMGGRAHRTVYSYSSLKEGDSLIIMGYPGIQAAVILSHYNIGSSGMGDVVRKLVSQRDMLLVSDHMKFLMDNFNHNEIRFMHDVTEGGLYGALNEIALASSLNLYIESQKIPENEYIKTYLFSLSLEPWSVTSEGCIVMGVQNQAAEEIVASLQGKNIPSSIIGRVGKPGDNSVIMDGKTIARKWKDPYWEALKQ